MKVDLPLVQYILCMFHTTVAFTRKESQFVKYSFYTVNYTRKTNWKLCQYCLQWIKVHVTKKKSMCVRKIRTWNSMNFIHENRPIRLIDIQSTPKMNSALSAAVIINPFLLTVEELFHRVLVEFFIVIRRSPHLCIVL